MLLGALLMYWLLKDERATAKIYNADQAETPS